jgi:proline racemase
MPQSWQLPLHLRRWQPPTPDRLTCLDYHTDGEALRLLIAGYPEAPGATMLARRNWWRQHADFLRQRIIFEPRGHADMYAAVLTPPEREASLCGVIFMHNEGYSTMCGHGILAILKALGDSGAVACHNGANHVQIDTPAGPVAGVIDYAAGQVKEVRFVNVPAFVEARELAIELDSTATISVAIAFGGAYYAFVDARDLDLRLEVDEVSEIIRLGREIKTAVQQKHPLRHPQSDDLGFLYGTIFTLPEQNPAYHSRQVCVFADGQLDRSPTGTGVSARAALLASGGSLRRGEEIAITSISGGHFRVRLLAETDFYQHAAFITEVTGHPHLCGRNELFLEADDAIANGFLLR